MKAPVVVVVGGGAAGLVAAERAAAGGARVLVLEAARDPGRKVLVSGGGRCNVLPAVDEPGRFISSSSGRVVRRFLDRFPLAAQGEYFESLLGGPLVPEPGTGKLFPPGGRARDVRDALVSAALKAGAEVRSGARAFDVAPSDPVVPGGALRVVLHGGETLEASAVVLATGGRSVLAQGADAAGFEIAARLGHTVRPTFPALVPLVAEPSPHAALSGVSLEARVTAVSGGERATADGGFLFTHRGWSGPAVLDVAHVVSRALAEGRPFRVTAALGVPRGEPVPDWDALLRPGSGTGPGGGTLLGLLSRRLPGRVAEAVLASAGVADTPLQRLLREDRRRVADAIASFVIPATGTEGYRTAEVTGGGVALEEVDPGSCASRLVPGLHLAGEILDAFGPIGGFNFQWAWATGRTAGTAAAAAAVAAAARGR